MNIFLTPGWQLIAGIWNQITVVDGRGWTFRGIFEARERCPDLTLVDIATLERIHPSPLFMRYY